jgi:hypothetical protein
MGSTCRTDGVKGNAYSILVGKPEGKRPLGRPRHMWMENTKMVLTWCGLDRFG